MANTLRIEVHALVGESGITLEDGQKVYDQIHLALRAGREVELDFSGVGVLASPFFNAAIGHLLQDVQPDELNRLLRVTSLVPAGSYTLRRVIENSKQYYSDPNIRQAVDEAIKEEAEAN